MDTARPHKAHAMSPPDDDDPFDEDDYHDPDHYYSPEDWVPTGDEED